MSPQASEITQHPPAPGETRLCCYTASSVSSRETSQLIRAARQGSQEALNTVLECYAVRLHALVRLRLGRRLRRRLESRDIVQATLLKAFLGIDRFDGGGSFMGWLAAIAVHEIRDQARYFGRGKRDAALDTSVDGKADFLAAELRSHTSQLQLDEDSRLLEQILDELAPDQREVIILRSFEELSFPQIATRMGRRPDACRKLFGRAMFSLTTRMKDARGSAEAE